MKNNWKEDFKKLCKHEYIDCVSHSEGQDCCLDSGHSRNKLIVDFIESLLAEQKKEWMEEIYAKDKIEKLNHD